MNDYDGIDRIKLARWVAEVRHELFRYEHALRQTLTVLRHRRWRRMTNQRTCPSQQKERDLAEIRNLRDSALHVRQQRMELLRTWRMLRRNKPYRARQPEEIIEACRTSIARLVIFFSVRITFARSALAEVKTIYLWEAELIQRFGFGKRFERLQSSFLGLVPEVLWSAIMTAARVESTGSLNRA